MILLSYGKNEKLGDDVYSYSMSTDSCIGKTEFCELCYGRKGKLQFPAPKFGFKKRWDLVRTNVKAFETIMLADMMKVKKDAIVRIHVLGDFASQAYVNAWKRICSVRPDVSFLAFTRSIQLTYKNKPDNMQVILSVDPYTLRYFDSYKARKREFDGVSYVDMDGDIPNVDGLSKAHICHGKCTECRYCFNPTIKNKYIIFGLH